MYFGTCAGVVGFSLAYLLCDYGGWPRLTYFPYEGGWGTTSGWPGAIPMNYVGTFLWGLAGALVLAAATVCGCALWRREAPERWLLLAGAWAVSSAGLTGLYFTWNLWPF